MTGNTVQATQPGEPEKHAEVGTGRGRRGPKPKPIAERLWAKVEKRADGCWIFTGCKAGGYGMIAIGRHSGRMQRAHRVAWELTHGPIPDGLEVCHRCDVPACVNAGEPGHPERGHLFLGTHSENMKDAAKKGRLTQIYFSRNRGEGNCRAKLTAEKVAAIRARFSRETAKALAAEYQISPYTVYAIAQGRIWRTAA